MSREYRALILEAKAARLSPKQRRLQAVTRMVRADGPAKAANRKRRQSFHPDNEIGLNQPGARGIRRSLGPNYSAGRERRFERMFGARKF